MIVYFLVWLLFTLLTLLFMQPYSWIMRFAPFLWIFPLACLMSLPEKRRAFLWLPLSIAFINIVGVSYFKIDATRLYSHNINQSINFDIGTWQADANTRIVTYTIPKNLMDESFKDETRLVTFMLRLRGMPSWFENSGQESTYGIRLDEMQIRPKEFP
jgi:hypothetical protein